jgi:hypothetical protein
MDGVSAAANLQIPYLDFAALGDSDVAWLSG